MSEANRPSRPRSKDLFARAQRVIPGGVNSPVRAFRAVGGEPLFFKSAAGAHLFDVDGQRYIDYVGSWGPMILGHAHPEIVAAIVEAAQHGTSFGAPTEREVVFAERLVQAMPSIERVRLVSSGTEATMSALRLSRGFTGRHKFVKIDGAYHGHADSLLVAAGSGAATLGIPGSAGVTPGAAKDTLTVAWNDRQALERVFAENPGAIASVIVEPVCGNMGCVPPQEGYLQAVAELARAEGALLIFDEVMTGFRVAFGGAQARYGIVPDLTCLGKIVGGGMPLAAYGGRAEIMDRIAPLGPVYQAGTLSGNPLAVAAGTKLLELLAQDLAVYDRLEARSARLVAGLVEILQKAAIPVVANRVGSMFTLFLTDQPVIDYTTAKTSDTARFAKLYRALLDRGVYLPPSQFEAAFVSAAHTDEIIDQTLAAARGAVAAL